MQTDTEDNMKRVWLAALGYWIIVSILVCCFSPALKGDGIARYIPMADAFARGEWELAFHPRFGFFFSAVAGLICKFTPLNGMMACQTTAFGMLALSGVAAWWFVRRVFENVTVAWIVFFLVVFAPIYTWPAALGYRDSGRTLALALIACGMVGEKNFLLGLGIFILTSLRADSWLVATAITGIWTIFCLVKHQWRKAILPGCGWLAGTMCVVTMTWLFFGYWLPSTQYIRQYIKYFGA